MKSLEVIEKVSTPKQPVNLTVRKAMSRLEDVIKTLPDHLVGDCYPLKHSFADGLYIREITVPGGILTVTKIHKYSHVAVLLKGEVSVIEEGGIRRVKAPGLFITPAGTKRIVFHHTEVVLTTIHATKETDLQKIEDEIIAKDFEEIPIIDIQEEKQLLDFVKEATMEKENGSPTP